MHIMEERVEVWDREKWWVPFVYVSMLPHHVALLVFLQFTQSMASWWLHVFYKRFLNYLKVSGKERVRHCVVSERRSAHLCILCGRQAYNCLNNRYHIKRQTSLQLLIQPVPYYAAEKLTIACITITILCGRQANYCLYNYYQFVPIRTCWMIFNP